MLKNEKLIHRLTLEQKVGILVCNNYKREPVDDYEFPLFSLLEEPMKKMSTTTKSTAFPSKETLARTWDLDLIKKVYSAKGRETARISDEMFIRFDGGNKADFIDDNYYSGKYINSAIAGINETYVIPVLSKPNSDDNFELSMLPIDLAMAKNDVKYIIVNSLEEIDYLKRHDQYNRDFIGRTGQNELVLQFILKEIPMICFLGDYDNLLEYVSNAVNSYNQKKQEYNEHKLPIGELNALINDGKIISMESIDKAVDKAINLFYEVKKYQNKPDFNAFINDETIALQEEESDSLAYEAAQKSIVMLKNNDCVLPIHPKDNVAFFGEWFKRDDDIKTKFVNEVPTFKNGFDLVSEYDAINYVGYCHGYVLNGEEESDLIAAALKLAEKADKFVIYLEAKDNETKLPDNQLALLDALKETGKPIISVVLSDNYVDPEFINKCDASLYVGSASQEMHKAILDILSGTISPSGKLTNNYPILNADTIVNESIIPLYTQDEPCAFPFGFGLSYTIFEFSHLEVFEHEAVFTVKNTSDYDGYCNVQLYVSKEDSKGFMKNKMVKGYAREFMTKGETRKMVIPFDEYTFRIYDEENKTYGIEGGDYEITIGTTAEDVKLESTINLSKFLIENKLFENKPVETDLTQVDMINYVDKKEKRGLKRGTKIFVHLLLLIYFGVSLYLIYSANANFQRSDVIYFVSLAIFGIAILITVISLIKTLAKKEVKYTPDMNDTLTKKLDKIDCFNSMVTYKYEAPVEEVVEASEGSETTPFDKETEEIQNSEAVNEETVNEEANNVISNEGEISASDAGIENVEMEVADDEGETIYDEDASLSLEEIEKYEEEEMKILEEQQSQNQSQFDVGEQEEIAFDTTSSLDEVITNFIKFASSKGILMQVSYVRTLFSALAASKMVFIRTNNDDLTNELLSIIAEFFGSKSRIVNANDNWASLFSISWNKNEQGEYEKSDFIEDMYKAGLLKNNFNLSIINNVSMKNFALYYDKCIKFANTPTRNYGLNISKQIKVYIPRNMHFIVAPKDFSYIKDLSEDIAKASVFIDLVLQKNMTPKPLEEELQYISNSYFDSLVHESLKEGYLSERYWKKIDEFIEEISERKPMELSNKNVLQIERYAAIYLYSGGEEVDLIDEIVSSKIIPLVISTRMLENPEDNKYVCELVKKVFGDDSIKKTMRVLSVESNGNI